MKISIPSNVSEVLKSRGISPDIVQQVVDYGESMKEKAILPAEKLNWAVKRIGNATYNVIYKDSGEVVTAYSYRVNIKGVVDYVEEDKSDWIYAKTGENLVRVRADAEYLGVVRSLTAWGCTATSTVFVEELMAVKTLAIAEQLLEQKAAR